MPDLVLPLIVEPSALARCLRRDDVRVVDLSDRKGLVERVRARRCVPGAVYLDPARLIAARPPAMGSVPDERQLGGVMSAIGLTPKTHVVAYDDAANANACRFLWILDLVGHRRFSLVNGGLGAWLAEGNPTARRFAQPPPGERRVTPQAGPIADKDYVLAHLDDPDVVILDTRAPGEFAGGHIPGAVNLEWTFAIEGGRHSRLKPEVESRALLDRAGVTPNYEIITHCAVHLRSAHTYIILKALGYSRIRGYPGSWSEWGNTSDLPSE